MDTQDRDDRTHVLLSDLTRRDALRYLGAGSLAAALVARGVTIAGAQDETPEPEPGLPPGVALVPMLEVTIDDMPPPPVTVQMARITLEPDASVPVSSYPFPTFAYVESGAIVCPGEAGRVVVSADGTARVVGAEDVPVNTGETIYHPANVADGARNEGTEPAVVLDVSFVPVDSMATPPA